MRRNYIISCFKVYFYGNLPPLILSFVTKIDRDVGGEGTTLPSLHFREQVQTGVLSRVSRPTRGGGDTWDSTTDPSGKSTYVFFGWSVDPLTVKETSPTVPVSPTQVSEIPPPPVSSSLPSWVET